MTEQAKTPPNEQPSEQDVQEFWKKFDEFFEGLSEREKPQAAAMVILADEPEDAQEVMSENGEAEGSQETESLGDLSEEEIRTFADKLNNFHDQLPDGQHQILDGLSATAFVHSVPEDEQDDVQGHVFGWAWTRSIGGSPTSMTFKRRLAYLRTFCRDENYGTLKYRYRTSSGAYTYGCWAPK